MTNPDSIAGAQEALHYVGLGDIDPRILGAVLDDHPKLAADGFLWGWTDTEVRDGVAQAVTCRLLHIDEAEFSRRLRSSEAGLDAEVMAAHARWLSDNPPPGKES